MKNRRILKTLFLILISATAFSQTHQITILVKGYAKSTLLLVDCAADKNAVVDSAKTDAVGLAQIKVPTYRAYGQFKIVVNGSETIEILCNNEDIVLETDVADLQRSLLIKKSDENKQYYAWMEASQQLKRKIDLLQQLYDGYPKDDAFIQKIVSEYELQVANYELVCNTPAQVNPKSYAARVIKAKREVFSPINVGIYEREFYARQHFFDYVDFRDTQLLSTNAYVKRAFDYLMRYTSKDYTKEQQIMMFKTAIDSLMHKMQPYQRPYDQAVDYLMNGFEGMGAGLLVQHIAERYVNQNTCDGEGKKTTLQRKVLSYTKLNDGMAAPTFKSTNELDKEVSMESLGTKPILLVFWASWCPHCEMMLPEIKSLYDKQKIKKFTFVTSSLDSNKVMWKTYLKLNNFTSSINLCDGKAWDGNMAQNYLIYATPSVFLIQNGKIIARPGNIDDMKAVLRRNNLIE